MQVIGLVRLVSSPEVLRLARGQRTDAKRRQAVEAWIKTAVDMSWIETGRDAR
jgi:hypothetical protein